MNFFGVIVKQTIREGWKLVKETKTYLGSSCKRGHSGLRYSKSSSCVLCAKLRNWETPAQRKAKQDSILLERKKRENSTTIYIGRPCKSCKGTERYVCNGACRACCIKASQEQVLRRREWYSTVVSLNQ